MAEKQRLIGTSADLADSGPGLRFEFCHDGKPAIGFAIRYGGRVRAYIDRCPHRPTELDWEPGRFFDAEGALLICSNHGAVFLPDTGECISGPCRGKRLTQVSVEEREGGIFI